ncbi:MULTISPECIES: hypothetical protein [unclassified Neochlamydia]|uniref:hypothetical protein n=1 Tax=unclassified Neochlamydia TaxID=2643326 RepID=UPI00140CE1E4|nr:MULTISPECIES: hypothetical protein [unclassified Neochlamydia]MBS4165903.1 Uncharacterized protein [Neochlamydia sp. AcF65]MBS4170548.1 Uncharacterized protein [Neochlamydia sp. AcF95]NGY96093.1 hypothetical protein [Neochlamydia sp. AcF84]
MKRIFNLLSLAIVATALTGCGCGWWSNSETDTSCAPRICEPRQAPSPYIWENTTNSDTTYY